MLRPLSLCIATTVVMALALTACSSDDDASSGGSSGSSGTAGTGGGAAGTAGSSGTGGAGGTGVSGSGGSSGTAGDGGSGGDSGSGGTGGSNFYQGGYVSLMQSVVTVSGTEYASYSFAAGFSRGELDANGSACDIHDDGPCRITDCTTEPSDAGTPTYETVSAGTVQVMGANQPLSLTPDASGTYDAITGQERLWSGGGTLTISASGGAVPAFQDTLFAAAPVNLTSPSLPAPGSPQITMSTSGPLNVAWNGGMGGTVTAMLTRSITGATTRTVMLMCTFPATDGAGIVPASAMAAIPPGPDGTFQVMGGDTKTIEPSGWTITLQEYVPAITQSGNVASVMATYQ